MTQPAGNFHISSEMGLEYLLYLNALNLWVNLGKYFIPMKQMGLTAPCQISEVDDQTFVVKSDGVFRRCLYHY